MIYIIIADLLDFNLLILIFNKNTTHSIALNSILVLHIKFFENASQFLRLNLLGIRHQY